MKQYDQSKFIVLGMLLITLMFIPKTVLGNAGVYPHFGARIGYGVSDVIGTAGSKDALSLIQSGFVNASLFFSLSHVEYVRFQIELDYHRRRFEAGALSVSAHAVSFPFLVQFRFPFGLISGIGFAPTYLIKHEFNHSSHVDSTFEKELQELAFDLITQVGWMWNIHEIVNIFFEIRFLYAINNISTSYQDNWHPYFLSTSIGLEY